MSAAVELFHTTVLMEKDYFQEYQTCKNNAQQTSLYTALDAT